MKMFNILTQAKDIITKNKAKRKAESLLRGQNTLIGKLEGERDTLLTSKEDLENVTLETVDDSSWCKKYQDVKVNLLLKEKELSIAEETKKEFFSKDS